MDKTIYKTNPKYPDPCPDPLGVSLHFSRVSQTHYRISPLSDFLYRIKKHRRTNSVAGNRTPLPETKNLNRKKCQARRNTNENTATAMKTTTFSTTATALHPQPPTPPPAPHPVINPNQNRTTKDHQQEEQVNPQHHQNRRYTFLIQITP